MTDLAALLHRVSLSAQPHLTWYSDGGAERVELSGRVLANWVSKAANLLDEEGIDSDCAVLIDLPVHWRTAIWSWAAWLRGATVHWGKDPSHEYDAAISSRPHDRDTADLVIAVPLAPLALSWKGDPLPSGVVDGAADLMTQADVLLSPLPSVGEALPGVPFSELIEGTDPLIEGTEPARRIALQPSDHTWVREALGLWAHGGSVVVMNDLNPATAQRIAAQESAVY